MTLNIQAFPSTQSVVRLLGGIVDEINADWETGRLFMSRESLGPVLGLERADMEWQPFSGQFSQRLMPANLNSTGLM